MGYHPDVAKDECPHCGEPVDEDATSCPHCGSDSETGWKPDTEYYALELPEEDDEEEAGRLSREEILSRVRALAGPALVAGAWLFFVVYGFSRFDPPLLVLVPAIYLALSITVVSRLAERSGTVGTAPRA